MARAGGASVRHRAFRFGLFIVAALLAANAVWLAGTGNLGLGTGLVALASLVFFVWGAWFPILVSSRLVTGFSIAVFAVVATMSTFLWAFGVRDTASYDEDAVIVLGAAVHGDELSPTLRGRLNAALEYHRRNPDALMVLSGGKGPGENVSEAEAMRRYLMDAEVPPELIVAEGRSTSTQENFAFSRELLEARLEPGYRVAFVTNEFHVYRARGLASSAGFEAGSVHSTTPFYFWAPMYLRECLAVAASWLR